MLCRQGGENDVVKILDFGLVKDLGQEAPELDGVIMGTPETMAPEAVYPEMMGPRSDLYSLAAVGYYLLTGTPVFEADDIRGYIRLHQTQQPERISTRQPGVPDDIEGIILRGLSKDPGMRARNAAAMRIELLQCADAGSWSATDANEWWSEFAKPSIMESGKTSTGSESVIATAVLGETTSMLIGGEWVAEGAVRTDGTDEATR
jgi:serine/threonine-protein kinase